MNSTEPRQPVASLTADREILITRVIGGPQELVFEVFTELRHLSQWWGPAGFSTTTKEFEFREGGEWIFEMHGPEGMQFNEWISWKEITPPDRIELLHGEFPGDPNAFESILTFSPDPAGTWLEMRTIFPTKELRDEVVEKYHAIEGGQQTLAKLNEYVTDLVKRGASR